MDSDCSRGSCNKSRLGKSRPKLTNQTHGWESLPYQCAQAVMGRLSVDPQEWIHLRQHQSDLWGMGRETAEGWLNKES